MQKTKYWINLQLYNQEPKFPYSAPAVIKYLGSATRKKGCFFQKHCFKNPKREDKDFKTGKLIKT